MNKLLCLLVVCVAACQAYKVPSYPKKIKYCYDFLGRPVYPGTSFSPDGCNTCMCGPYGQPRACTLMACDPIKPVYPPIKPIRPVYPPIKPIKPVYPPIRPIKPVYPPIKPVYPPIKPIKPVYPPIKPIKPVYPPIKPIKPFRPVRPVYPTKKRMPIMY